MHPPDFFLHVPVPSPEAPARVPVTDNGTDGLRCALQPQPSGDQFAFQAPGGRDLGKAADCCTAEITSAAPGPSRRAGPGRGASVGDDRPVGRWDTGGGAGGIARPGEAAPGPADPGWPPVAFDRDALLLLEAQGMDLTAAEHAIAYPDREHRRAHRVLAGMERVLSGVQPTDPPEMVAYWRRVRDREIGRAHV